MQRATISAQPLRAQDGRTLNTPRQPLLIRLARDASLLYILFALLTVLVAKAPSWFRGMREPIISHGFLFLTIAVLAGILLCILCAATPKPRISHRTFLGITVLATLLLLFMQIYLLYSGFFITDWDAGRIASTAYDPEGLLTDASQNDYFSTYPNQLALLGIFQLLVQAAKFVGLASFPRAYFVLAAGGCLCISTSVAMAALTAEKLGGQRSGLLSLAVGIPLVGLCPWFFVPYSDAYGMPFVTGMVFAYACDKNLIRRMAVITFLGVFGYFVKPTVLLALIAIALAELVTMLVTKLRGKAIDRGANLRVSWRRLSLACAVILASSLCALGADYLLTARISTGLDSSKSTPMTFYLAMGANASSNGRWTPEEYEFAHSIADPDERKEALLARWEQRIEDLGPEGVAKLAVKKTANNYLDGSFFWENEGSFYAEVIGTNQAVKDFYNIGHTKNWEAPEENPTPYFAIAQTLWFFVLVGCILNLLRRRPSTTECAIAIAILAVSLFLTIFECRARYLFLYTPCFVILATLGWSSLSKRLKRHVKSEA